MAVSLVGRPRYTNDIDLVILDLDDRLPEIISRLKKLGIEPRIEDVTKFAHKSRVKEFADVLEREDIYDNIKRLIANQ